MVNLGDNKDIENFFLELLISSNDEGRVACHHVEVLPAPPLFDPAIPKNDAACLKHKVPRPIQKLPEKRFFAKVVPPGKSPYFHWVVYPCYLLSDLDL